MKISGFFWSFAEQVVEKRASTSSAVSKKEELRYPVSMSDAKTPSPQHHGMTEHITPCPKQTPQGATIVEKQANNKGD